MSFKYLEYSRIDYGRYKEYLLLFNDDEQRVNTEKLCVLQRNNEQLKVIFNEINALSNGQVHSGSYTIHKNGLLVHDKYDKLRDDIFYLKKNKILLFNKKFLSQFCGTFCVSFNLDRGDRILVIDYMIINCLVTVVLSHPLGFCAKI